MATNFFEQILLNASALGLRAPVPHPGGDVPDEVVLARRRKNKAARKARRITRSRDHR